MSTVVCWYLLCCVHCWLLVPSLLCPLLSVGTFPAVSTVVCWSSGHVPILPWSPMVSPAVYLLVTLTACSHCCCRLPLVIPQRGCSYICTRVVKMSSRPGSFSSSTRRQSSMHSVNKTTNKQYSTGRMTHVIRPTCEALSNCVCVFCFGLTVSVPFFCAT